MTTQLMQKLKDAGFPISNKCPVCDYPDDQAFLPTLEEAIEACGDEFTVLKRMVGNPFAYGNPDDKTVWWSCPLGDLVNEGSTPLEAVINLYLSLKGKR